MASAQEQLNMPQDFNSFYNDYGFNRYGKNWIEDSPNSLSGRVQNFFKGTVSDAKQAYDNYLTAFSHQNSLANSAKGLEKAGYNPWLAVQNGLSSASEAFSVKDHDSNSKLKDITKLVVSALMIMKLLA